jgi:hypothetical protein
VAEPFRLSRRITEAVDTRRTHSCVTIPGRPREADSFFGQINHSKFEGMIGVLQSGATCQGLNSEKIVTA